MRPLTLLVGAASLLVAACAGYAIQEGGAGAGYDVYRPEPYLLRKPIVKSKTLVGFDFETVYLPNYSKRYRFRSWTGFGASNIQFLFEDGWRLTGMKDKTKNTEVLKQLGILTEHLVPANPLEIAQSGRGGPPQAAELDHRERLRAASMDPVLYRIEIAADGRPTCELVRLLPEDCATATLPR